MDASLKPSSLSLPPRNAGRPTPSTQMATSLRQRACARWMQSTGSNLPMTPLPSCNSGLRPARRRIRFTASSATGVPSPSCPASAHRQPEPDASTTSAQIASPRRSEGFQFLRRGRLHPNKDRLPETPTTRGINSVRLGWFRFASFLAYLRRKRSIRPAVSSTFCLPVKNGWQAEQISTWMSPRFVLRVTKAIAAGALHVDLFVLWVGCCFHKSSSVCWNRLLSVTCAAAARQPSRRAPQADEQVSAI